MVAYHYDFRIALVKGSPNVVAANATVLVYDPLDVTYTTPITVYSNPGLTTIVNLVTDQYGIIPDFWSDKPDLLWKSGTLTGGWATTSSRPGIRGITGAQGPEGPMGPNGTPGLNGQNGEVARWETGFAYTVGAPLINPDGDLVKVTTAHTSGGSYDATKFSTPYDSAVTTLISTSGSAPRAALKTAMGEVTGLSTTDGALNADILDAAIAAAVPGDIITIPPGVWPISRAILVNKGVHIRGRGRAELVRAVFGTPVIDALDAPTPPTFEGLILTCTATRINMAGTFRGGSANSYAAAIWTNVNGTVIRNVKAIGFTTALMAINWNTTTSTRTGFVTDITVDDLESTGCDWAVLGAGLKRMSLNKIHGTYSLRAGSGDPSHLIYISDGSPNEDISVTNCYAYDGTGGHAYQFKAVNGLELSNIKARNCEGLISIANVQKMIATQLSSIADVAPSDGSIFMQGIGAPADLSMSDVFLDIANQNRAIRWDGTNGSLKNVEIRTARTVSSDDYDMTIQGTGSVIENVQVINSGVGERRALGILAGKHRLINTVAKETKAVVTIVSTAADANVVEFDPVASIRRVITGSRTISTAGKLTTIIRPKPTRTAFATGAGEAVGIRADETTTAVVTISGATNFSISAPIEPFSGATVTFEFTNITAGAVGTITWNASFVLSSALASPAAGLTTNITFVYNGTKWVEERRV